MASQWPHAFMRTAEGITLHYVDVGPRDALPVVLVHGWPDLWFGWRHQIQALQSTYRLIVPDLRGFGQSSTPQNVEAYGAKNVTNDLAALLDGLNIEKAVFAGHDWGGYQESVWRMCLYHPKRVIAVCAVCTAFTPPAKRLVPLDVVVAHVPYFAYQKLLADAENTGKMLDAAPRRFLTAVFRKHTEMSPTLEDESKPIVGTLQGVTHSPDPIFTQRSAMLSEEEMQYYVDQYSRSKFQSTCQYYATRDIDFKDEQGLPSVINHPAMFIAAANDHVLKPELARKMARFLPNLETHVVDDAGHWVLWEQTARVNALLKTWLAKIPAPPRSDRCKL
ncbi:Bifunctional epoxide hydrolase 2 [Phytophthora ramorum]|uniref:Bifunctional epoxide hydrolase 2 n=1 Tax=Phytophthora ramorum TaxID=164328 RepID=UPI0030A96064|nr:Bifunctional epoxide hydrolase 2 [Phytophthora ramorum]